MDKDRLIDDCKIDISESTRREIIRCITYRLE